MEKPPEKKRRMNVAACVRDAAKVGVESHQAPDNQQEAAITVSLRLCIPSMMRRHV